jgi:prophage tail gpP-like protein
MFPLDYTIEESANGQFIVRVGEDVAGHMSEDAEHPGLWVLEDADGQLVGQHHDQEDGAAFLALRFAAGGQDQQ